MKYKAHSGAEKQLKLMTANWNVCDIVVHLKMKILS